MKQGKRALFSVGMLLVGILFSLITYIGLTLLGVVDLSSKETLTFYVNDVSKEYDGEPLRANSYRMEGNLPEDYSIYVDYIGELTNIGEQKASVDIKIYNEDNAEVTNQFEIVVFQGTIQITEKVIEVAISNNEYFIIDGKLSVNLITKKETNVLPGHTLKAKIPSDFNYATDGIENLEIEPQVINENGRDVTHYYNIKFKMPETLTRGLTPIKVTVVDFEKEYDGTPFVPEVILLDGTLEKGHKVVAIPLTNEYEVGTYNNYEVTYAVKNLEGEDVTGMYKISGLNKYTVKIVPRKITIEPYETVKFYDGTIFDETEAGIIYGSLVGDDIATITFNTPLTTVGTTTTTLSARVETSSGDDVTDQYEISFKKNQVVISMEKASIHLSVGTTKKAYDGLPFGELEENVDYVISLGKILEGHKMTVKYKDDFSSIGEKTTQLEVEILGPNGEDVTEYYNLVYESSYDIEIVGQEILINVGTGFSKVYDGKTLKENVSYKEAMETLTYTFAQSYPGLGSIKLKDEYENLVDATDGAIKLTGNMFEATGEAADGFSFKVEGSPTLEIVKKEAKLQLTDNIDEIVRTYNGQAIEITSSMVTSDDFIDNHEVISVNSTKFDLDYAIINSEGSLSVLSVTIYDKEKNIDVTHNYNLDFTSVRNVYTYFQLIEINVKAKDITVDVDFDVDEDSLADYINSYYDADSLYEITGGNKLFDGHVAVHESAYSVYEDSGVYYLSLGNGFDIVYGHPTQGPSSVVDIVYDVNMIPGIITVKVKEKTDVSIVLPSATFEYDGTTTAEDIALEAIQKMTLPHNMSINAYSFADLQEVDPGTYSYTIDPMDIDGYDEELYNLSITPGTITILSKQTAKENISIIVPSVTFEYDGTTTAAELAEQQINAMTLPTGFTISYIDYSGLYEVEPGVYTYTIDPINIDGYDEEKHNLTITPGTITILSKQTVKENISIVLPSVTKEYDGVTTAAELAEQQINAMTLPSGFTISYIDYSGLYEVEPGVYTYTIDPINLDGYDEDKHNLTITPGTITILSSKQEQKYLNISLPSLTKEYDGDSFETEISTYLSSLSLPDGITVYVGSFTFSTEVGTQIIGASDLSIDFGTNDADDYLVNVSAGVLTITKKTLTVYVPDIKVSESADICVVIESILAEMLTDADAASEVSYSVSSSAATLTEGTYALKDYVSFSCDTSCYKLVISSIGTLTVTA